LDNNGTKVLTSTRAKTARTGNDGGSDDGCGTGTGTEEARKGKQPSDAMRKSSKKISVEVADDGSRIQCHDSRRDQVRWSQNRPTALRALTPTERAPRGLRGEHLYP